jgi:hypothetical protein
MLLAAGAPRKLNGAATPKRGTKTMNFLRRTWSLQYTSSLYANRCWRTAWSNLLPGKGNALALLGNCVSVATAAEREESREFLLRCSTTWERVFLIPGPGEFAGGENHIPFWCLSDEMRNLAQEIEDIGGGAAIEVLEQGEVTIPFQDIVVLGTGGWGATESGPLKGVAANIRFAKGIDPAKEMTTWCEEDMAFLLARVRWHLHNTPEARIIILTHSLSSGHLLQRGLPAAVYERIPQEVIPVDLSSPILKRPNVYAWLSGALGSCVSGMNNGTFTSGNAFYTTENRSATNPNYMVDRHITIDSKGGWGPSFTPSRSGGSTARAIALQPELA